MAALFGYSDEAGFEKQIEEEHSRHSRNPSRRVKSDDDRYAFLILVTTNNCHFVFGYYLCFVLVLSVTNKKSYKLILIVVKCLYLNFLCLLQLYFTLLCLN